MPAAASAHPLGNFSVNHLARGQRVRRPGRRHATSLDEAEIPTFQQSGGADARCRAEVARRLTLTVDGRRVALRPPGAPTITQPHGPGRAEDDARSCSPLAASGRETRARVELDDGTFPGRVGWKAIVARPGNGTATRSSAPADDPTNGLRVYPEDLLKSPADLRAARLDVAPGSGTLDAPGGKP